MVQRDAGGDGAAGHRRRRTLVEGVVGAVRREKKKVGSSELGGERWAGWGQVGQFC
jgi:hypothetical protein